MTTEVIEELEDELRHILCQEVMGRTDLYYEREKLVSIRARLRSLLEESKREPERRCEMCRSFHRGTSTCSSEWAPLACALDNFSGWEARPDA